MKKIITIQFLILFLCMPMCIGAPTPSQPKWTDRVAWNIFVYMKKHHELKGRKYSEIYDRVLDVEWASHYNPSWGPDSIDGRRLITIKLLTAWHWESCLDPNCIQPNLSKKNGLVNSIDYGMCAVNSVHVFLIDKTSLWYRFCVMEKVKHPDDFKNVMDPELNCKFAAMLNEAFIKDGNDTYHYYENPTQREFYDMLIKVTGLKTLALKYNDGQYESNIDNMVALK